MAIFSIFLGGDAGEVRGEDGLGGVSRLSNNGRLWLSDSGSLWLKSSLHPKKRSNIFVFPQTAFLCGRVLIDIVSMTAESSYEGVFSVEARGEDLIRAPDQGGNRRKKGS